MALCEARIGNGEGAASVAVETPRYWRCWDHGAFTKDSGRQLQNGSSLNKTKCAVDGRIRAERLPKPFGAQKFISEPQILDTKLFI